MADESMHSRLSPSKAKRYVQCPGSVFLTQHTPDPGNKYTAEGTAAHTLAEWCLTEEKPAEAFLGRVIVVEQDDTKHEFTVDDTMAGHVQKYVDYVADLMTPMTDEPVVSWFEHTFDLSPILGPGEQGTGDAVLHVDGVTHVVDLKYGQGVRVEAEDNPQLELYALGAALALDNWKAPVVVHIVQPRLNHISSVSIEPPRLPGLATLFIDAARKVRDAFEDRSMMDDDAWNKTYLNPGEEACRFCTAKATCPALRAEVASAMLDRPRAAISDSDWDDVVEVLPTHAPLAESSALGRMLSKLGLVRTWAAAVEEEALKRLQAGGTIEGWKVVKGKAGPPQWTNEEHAETLLKGFRFKKEEMYKYSLIAPGAARKLVADNPRRLQKVNALVRETGGNPTLAPASDKRPALAPNVAQEEDFDDLTG